MNEAGNTWVIVLAAGDGRRLQSLTTDARGVAVPKQFCSLSSGPTLLDETLGRALMITSPARVVAIVAGAHEHWWRPLLAPLPADNIIVQPANRGTGNGIMLPVLQILDRDPEARILVMPSDHYVADEPVLIAGMRRALRALERVSEDVLLLGIAPDEVDPDLGYIEPGAAAGDGLYAVEQFIEKPSAALAGELIASGGLWNSFIMAARGQALLDLYANRFPEVVLAMVGALRVGRRGCWSRLRRLYDHLPAIDFSRHVITGAEARLRLMPVPACGWSDLGTPERVSRTLARLPGGELPAPTSPFINLAAAHRRAATDGLHAIA